MKVSPKRYSTSKSSTPPPLYKDVERFRLGIVYSLENEFSFLPILCGMEQCMVLARLIEIISGVVFVVAALLKAFDLQSFAVQIRYYGVLPTYDTIRYAALLSIAVETLLGAALLISARLRGLTHISANVMLVVFSGLVLYAWIFHDLKDCGCFGKVLPLGPMETLVKNAIMLVGLTYAWNKTRKVAPAAPTPSRETIKSIIGAASILSVAAVILLADNAAFFKTERLDETRPFSSFRFQTSEGSLISLDDGNFLVAMLSSTCEDCAAAVAPLNEFHRFYASIPVVGLILGDEGQVEQFVTMTKPEFPVQRIEPTLFFRLISVTEPPPRFYFVQDGVPLRHWDTTTVDLEKLIGFVEGNKPE